MEGNSDVSVLCLLRAVAVYDGESAANCIRVWGSVATFEGKSVAAELNGGED